MLTSQRLFPLVFLSAALPWLAGCISSTITNLTPTVQTRSGTGQYRIEYTWDSNQQALRPTTITPYVIIGFESYPMQQVLRTRNRWETWVPAPAGADAIHYHFKVDYQYNRYGQPGKGSRLSPEYTLAIK